MCPDLGLCGVKIVHKFAKVVSSAMWRDSCTDSQRSPLPADDIHATTQFDWM